MYCQHRNVYFTKLCYKSVDVICDIVYIWTRIVDKIGQLVHLSLQMSKYKTKFDSKGRSDIQVI